MGVDWDEFRDRLKAAIAERPDRPYYESWLDALEDLTASPAASSALIRRSIAARISSVSSAARWTRTRYGRSPRGLATRL